MNKNLIFYDTDCLSCFISINDTSIIEKLFKEIYIPKQVYDEFAAEPSQRLVKRVNKLIKKGFIIVEDIETETVEYLTYKSLKKGELTYRYIGKG